MNVWSLFSGVGGLDLGIERAGGTVVLQCEADPWRREVLASRFPGVPCFPDVAALRVEPAPGAEGDGRVAVSDGAGRLHTVAVPDLLIGGFPCQDVSVAGQRRGLAGKRTGLFFDACRLIEAVRPRAVLLENVPGLLSSQGGRDFGVVLATLADLGYGLAWRILDSRFFGVPQRRRRVFICGVDTPGRAGAELAGEVLAVGSRCSRHPATGAEEGQDDPPDAVAGTLGGRRGFAGDDIDRGGHTSLSGLGNGGPDDNDAQAGRLVVAAPLTSGGHSDGVSAPGRRKEDDVNIVAFHSTGGGAKALAESEDVSPGTGTGRAGQVAVALTAKGKQGDQENYVTFTARGREGGTQIEVQDDGVHPALRSGRGGGRRDSGIAGTVRSHVRPGSNASTEVVEGQIVRRLLPVECERLQSFPDGWTDLGETADTPRYSAMGDAVTVNVAEWIGGRL